LYEFHEFKIQNKGEQKKKRGSYLLTQNEGF
jgi:hypothetical protein